MIRKIYQLNDSHKSKSLINYCQINLRVKYDSSQNQIYQKKMNRLKSKINDACQT